MVSNTDQMRTLRYVCPHCGTVSFTDYKPLSPGVLKPTPLTEDFPYTCQRCVISSLRPKNPKGSPDEVPPETLLPS